MAAYTIPTPFTKARTICFLLVSMLAFIYTILLCVFIFARWDVSDTSERSFAFVMILVNTITVIMLPALILLEFRPWLDGARMLLLLIAHISVATAFAVHDQKFQCHESTPDGTGVCELLNIYILLANWIVPGLLIVYSAALAYVAYRCWKQPLGDAESGVVPAMAASMPSATVLTVEDIRNLPPRSSHISQLDAMRSSNSSRSTLTSVDTQSNHRKSNRLSRPVPRNQF
ncbi:hypothetical protein PUNSTDRAFT_121562 [Punctularia strigosozonata HHB-11173 SS5]|uniref:uncharacterized protein n=1 Tax=Punctularia strigosozonata (strain HHB-11173) TaxID=741275 RepID=UPI000441678E|nr:uncharacterized protein PUNSTDRAFT_121562 [Punctularia strigosozonata HHB-11173 SS5]EIN07453.1 hypothetical protein PUNSTDRAFT_121562 [Punctularia strigosozonata HHB-11173 SS5]